MISEEKNGNHEIVPEKERSGDTEPIVYIQGDGPNCIKIALYYKTLESRHVISKNVAF